MNLNKFILLSAFQKDIRRCNPMCLYWTRELSYNHEDLIWTKMIVIGSEDIGIASPTIQTFIYNQKKLYDESKDLWIRRTILMNTVNHLINQNKSRICDNVNHAYFKNFQPSIGHTNINDILKIFTQSIQDKDYQLAFKYACHLYKNNKERWIINTLKNPKDIHVDILINLFDRYNKTVRGKTDILFLSHLILYRTFDLDKIQSNPNIPELTIDDVKNIYNNDVELVIEDYVYDKHTNEGKKLGRGFEHFYDQGAKLVNCYIDDPFEEIAKCNNCLHK